MNGHVLQHPPIAVDSWSLSKSAHVQLFFLSHMHSDHTEGLTPSWSQPIYCSPVTRILLLDQFKLNPQQVHGLDLNESHCLPLAADSDVFLTVTLINANHCPGAVMFLFEGYFGRILYTGDFRYSQVLNCEESFSCICSSAVDKLYLDNTFCSPRCEFPSREKAMAEILQIISQHPDHQVVIGLRRLGKEALVVAIAKHFRMPICVTEERLHWLELLKVPNVFTTVESETRLKVVDQRLINPRNMDFWNEEMPTIAIIPTALHSVVDLNNGLNRSDVFVVLYSDHSSFTELLEFVSVVSPRVVIPILTDVKDRLGRAIPERADMSCFAEYLDKSPAPPFCPPMFKKNLVVKTRAGCRVKNSQNGGSVRKKYKFKALMHRKGVVYEHACGEEESQKSVPHVLNDPTVENADNRVAKDLTVKTADNRTDEQKVENSNGVAESVFIDLAATPDACKLVGPSVLSNKCECIKCRELGSGKLLCDDKNVNSCSIAESMAVAQLQPGDSMSNVCRTEENLVTMPCLRSEENVRVVVSRERSELSDFILQRLQPLFIEEAWNMFQNFLRANRKK